jgi:plasmid maintenance system antidote protein VapI
MSKPTTPITDLLLRTIRDAVEAGQTNYKALQRETGLTRGSIMRFVAGKQSLRLDMADRLAVRFGLELRVKRRERKGR